MSSGSWIESPHPSSATPRTRRRSFAPAVAEVAGLLGVELMGWQRLTLDRAMEHKGGRPAYREVNLSTPRQVGKSTLFLLVALHRMLASPGSWVTYTTASRLAGRRKLLRTWWPLIASSPLRDRFRPTKGTGSESLECSNGSTLLLLSGDEASGHGDSIDLGIVDEAWSLTDAAEAGVRPAMSARPAAQLWVTSTAGGAKSSFWRAKVDAGRASVEAGVTEGTCFVEWSAAGVEDPTDPVTWPGFHPALGRTHDTTTMAADLAADTTPNKAEWKRAWANLWPDESESGWNVISLADWKRATSG
jgi:phage terminase large subunit-like protein